MSETTKRIDKLEEKVSKLTNKLEGLEHIIIESAENKFKELINKFNVKLITEIIEEATGRKISK